MQVRWQRAEPLPWDLPLPRLVLQPLVENAVLHGISRLPEGGAVEIALAADARWLHVEVGNPAPPPGAPDGPGAGSGHAQRSIAHRLGYAFGPEARMEGHWDEGYYRAGFRVPLRSERPGRMPP
jgi:two-component system sensor histidine kinase AlgZ